MLLFPASRTRKRLRLALGVGEHEVEFLAEQFHEIERHLLDRVAAGLRALARRARRVLPIGAENGRLIQRAVGQRQRVGGGGGRNFAPQKVDEPLEGGKVSGREVMHKRGGGGALAGFVLDLVAEEKEKTQNEQKPGTDDSFFRAINEDGCLRLTVRSLQKREREEKHEIKPGTDDSFIRAINEEIGMAASL